MKTQSLVNAAVAGVLGLSMAGAANATVVFGDGGAALQGVLNNITTNPLNNSSVNVVTDQLVPDEYWNITGSGVAASQFIIELAGFAGVNSFGVYDPSTLLRAEIYSGIATAGDIATLSLFDNFNGTYSVIVSFFDASTGIFSGGDTGIDFQSQTFGFYLDSTGGGAAGGLWYSDTSLNTDGVDHMAAYRGTGDEIKLPSTAPDIWTGNEYILAWEDLAGGGDRDYVDMVLMIESVRPIPEPGILALLGLGLLGMVGGRRFTKA